MRRRRRPSVEKQSPVVQQEEVDSLRTVVLQHNGDCFLDTDGVTRDAARMLQIMDGWLPNRSDLEAGVRRNGAFDPELSVVVTGDLRICYPRGVRHAGEHQLLFTIVPRDAV